MGGKRVKLAPNVFLLVVVAKKIAALIPHNML
jgi:hypothetical protein